MAHDILGFEKGKTNALFPIQNINDVAQARPSIIRQINLGNVASNDSG